MNKVKQPISLAAAAVALLLSATVRAQDALADNMLLHQRNVGGWPKQINGQKVDYTKTLTPAEKAGVQAGAGGKDATIDNHATTKEIRHLVAAFRQTGNKAYLQAAEKGIRYLLTMQNNKGGFPQYYPDISLYRSQVTYNDNAMIDALNVLWDAAHATAGFEVVDAALKQPAQQAIEKAIDCILKTQLTVNGKLTAWCTQYDSQTLQPAKARAFELPCISAAESVGIVNFLMKVEQPSADVKAAIEGAVNWLRSVKIEGYKYADIADASLPKGKDRVVLPEAGSVLWARFYDIETGKPFFCGRDGVKKWSVAEIEHERRIGYAWYGTWAQKLLDKEYPNWQKKQAAGNKQVAKGNSFIGN
ncbi:pectate lyase [Paraflavisolibacter sp. H34]|uniref:pectate lyase n=1 Tax=Huijunlia imazamoxiresistens TaxID=3127457 RepID=UPI0030175601